jgi:hypothetical protein
VIGFSQEVTMPTERKHDCEGDCDHTPKFEPPPPLDKGETAEPKHTEATPMPPIVPLGS